MYSIGGWLDYVRARPGARAEATARVIPKNVLFLGLTSLFTDISSEMVVSILPVYLVGFLRLSPLQYGIVDGLYQGIAGFVQLASALVADRWRRHKEVAAIGYAASALCRVGLLLTTGWTGITTLLTLDRLGKGMRSAPRDALISLSVPPERLGIAFGVHRAMDAVGAMLGPIVAFSILYALPNGFDVIFVASLGVAVIGVAILLTFVQNARQPAAHGHTDSEARATAAQAFALLRRPAFRHLALAALLFGGLTISDGFVYLTLQEQAQISPGAFPLLYVMTSASYLVFAVPVGRIADRGGRLPVFVIGHALLLILYGCLTGLLSGVPLIAVTLLLLGLYYAATEGVLMALGSVHLPAHLRTSGLALLTTTMAVARLVGSAVFGLGWNSFGLRSTIIGYMIALGVGIVVVVVSRPKQELA